ncbi:hypothetical protein OIU78_010738 [Salix suchowensis]|nr:hypothetical protein OIU78_010738 [Salix suchowensis]
MKEVTKTLITSDIERRLLLPENCLKNFPRGRETFLKIRDEDGIVWTFRCRIPPGNHSKPALYGEYWSAFVRQKGLKAGDIIVIVFNKVVAPAAGPGGDHFEIKVKKTSPETRN